MIFLNMQAVCTQLGFRGTLAALTDHSFGGGTLPITMFNVACGGTENYLAECTHNAQLLSGACLHMDQAYVAAVRLFIR